MGPILSNRRHIVVIADEAHRSQYDFLDAPAPHPRHGLPRASFIAFADTPIELKDANTRAAFGDYIDIYDIKQAVDDLGWVSDSSSSTIALVVFVEWNQFGNRSPPCRN